MPKTPLPERFLLLTLLSACSLLHAVPHPGQVAGTPITEEILDPEVSIVWVGDIEQPLSGEQLTSIAWTDSTTTSFRALKFGDTQAQGPRHVRIGFTEPVSIGTLLVRGNAAPSALKPTATYPGDPSRDSEWIPAERIEQQMVTTETSEEHDLSLWVFPAGTSTRALRFTHVADPLDADYSGRLAGFFAYSERLINLAPLAQVSASAESRHIPKVVNENYDGWGAWENVNLNASRLEKMPVISFSTPEWILLNWAEPVSLDGLIGIWTGFGAMEVQRYTGRAETHPRDASEEDWTTFQTFEGISSRYPTALWPHFFPFDESVTTLALRIRITAPSVENHPHVVNKTADGKRVWLGELIAYQNIGSEPLTPPDIKEVANEEIHPPIPIAFTLPEDGYVTLVIEDASGRRVRNLVSETWFPAGENTVWWDGTHDLDRDLNAAKHGLFSIPARFVEPGSYRVRGLWRKKIEAFYEFPTYNVGNPPWNTSDHTGAWLANHSAPSSAVFVPAEQSPTGEPAVFLGAYITEGPDGLIWTDLEMKKLGGMRWIGGNWTAAPYTARDTGPDSDPEVSLYVASVWATAKGAKTEELRITALEKQENGTLKTRTVFRGELEGENPGNHFNTIRGVAAYNDVIAVSINRLNQLLFINGTTGEILGRSEVPDPRGLTYDDQGRLFLLLQTGLLRFDPPSSPEASIQSKVILPGGLEDPFGVALDSDGKVYVSDWGNSHQVKVFANPESLPDLQIPASDPYPDRYVPVGVIGNPGAPRAGAYDPEHMNHPAGITIDSENRLWVAEHDYLPKRISRWTLDGELVEAVYGPSKYGGGGQIDPEDKTKFYYSDETRGAMEFSLDWENGSASLSSVLFRKGPGTLDLPRRSAAPESAVYHDGQRYFHNSYNSDPTAGNAITVLFIDREGVAVPAAAMGRANNWPLLQSEEFLPRWTAETNPNGKAWKNDGRTQVFFIWVDDNEDGHLQPEETQFYPLHGSGVTIMEDLSFIVARLEDETVRFRPSSFSATGIPSYDFDKREILATGVMPPGSSGGNQALADESDEMIVTLGMEPFHRYSFSGATNQIPQWSYPNLWPGLHASHHAAKPDAPGQLIGPTRIMGGFIHPAGEEIGPLWAVNANMGNFYLFTRDGLFVATVFEDSRLGKPWKMKTTERGMSLEGLTLNTENFWPTLSQTSDGNVYLVDGGRSTIVRLDGLDTLQPILPMPLEVSTEDLRAAQSWVEDREAARQAAFGSGVMTAQIVDGPPSLDGDLSEWADADWVEIDRRGDGANFNSTAKPYHVYGAIRTDRRNLYAAWNTRDGKLLINSGEAPNALFKTGGALDLMIGTDESADPERTEPTAGDMRLLIAKVDGETKALLYRPVVPGTAPEDRIPFTSPVWTISFDQVVDISDQVILAEDGEGNYEIAVQLSALGIDPKPGLRTKGDIGILRGDANQTNSRTYWSNKATTITADVPSEAKLSPHLWGTIEWK